MDIVSKLSSLRLSDGSSAGERIFSGGHASNNDMTNNNNNNSDLVDSRGNTYNSDIRRRKESNVMDDKMMRSGTYNSENKNVHAQVRRNKRKTGGSTIYNKNKNITTSPVYNVVNRNRASPPSLLLPQTTKESANEQFARYNKKVNDNNTSPQSELYIYKNNINNNVITGNNNQRQEIRLHQEEQQQQWLKKYALPSYQDSQAATHTSEQPKMYMQSNMSKSNTNLMRYDNHEVPRTADPINANTQSWNNKDHSRKESSKYTNSVKNKETHASNDQKTQRDVIVRETRPRSAATANLTNAANDIVTASSSSNNNNNSCKVEIDISNVNDASGTRKSLGERAPLSTLMPSQSPTSLRDLAQRLTFDSESNTNTWHGHSEHALPNAHTSPSLSNTTTNNRLQLPPPANSTLASSLLSQLHNNLSEQNDSLSRLVQNNGAEFTKLNTESKYMSEPNLNGSNSKNNSVELKGKNVQSISDLLAKTANSLHWEMSTAGGTGNSDLVMLQTQNEFANKMIDVKSVEANSHFSSFIEQQMLNARRADKNSSTARASELEQQQQQEQQEQQKERNIGNPFNQDVQDNAKLVNVSESSSNNNNRYSIQEVESTLNKIQVNNSNTETTTTTTITKNNNEADVNKAQGTGEHDESEQHHHHHHRKHNESDVATKSTEVTEKHSNHHSSKNEKHIQVQYMPHNGYNDSASLINSTIEEAMNVNAFLELNFELNGEYASNISAKFSEVSDNYNASSPIIRTLKRLPDNGRNIIIGDVHGCVEQLERLIEKVKYVDGRDRLIVIGDYVNKGPDSIGVIRMCQKHHAIGILGNHDFTLINCIARNRRRAYTPEELRDPVKKLAKDFPLDCEYYLRRLPHIIRIPECNLILVHAGLNPQHTLPQQSVMEIMHLRRLEEVTSTSQITNSSLATATVTTVNNNDVSSKTITTNTNTNSSNNNTGTKDGSNHSSSEDSKHYRAITKGTAGVPWATVWNGPEHVIFGHDAASGFQAHSFAYGIDTGCVYGDPLTCVIYSGESTSGTFCSVPGLPRHSNELMGLPPPRADIYEQLQPNLEKSIIRPTTATTPITAFRSAASAFAAFPPNYIHDGNYRSGSSACSPISRLTSSMCAIIPVPITTNTTNTNNELLLQQKEGQKATKELTNTNNTKEAQKLTSELSSEVGSQPPPPPPPRHLAPHQPLPESQREKKQDSPFSPVSSQNGSLMASPVLRYVSAPNDPTAAVQAAAMIGTREVQKATLLALSTAREITALLLVLSMPVYELEFDNMMSEDANDHTAQEAFWLPFARGIIDAALSVSTENNCNNNISKIISSSDYNTRQRHHNKESQDDNGDITGSDVIENIEELLHVALSVCESMNEVKDKLHNELNNLISDVHVHKWSRGIRKYISVVL